MPSGNVEKVRRGSDRILNVLIDLYNEGYDYRVIRLALIDAAVVLGRAALGDEENEVPVAPLLRGFASLILDMADNEVAVERREQIHLVEDNNP